MKKILFVLILLFIPIFVSAKTAIDPYGNEYEVYEDTPSDFSEDNIASEHNVTNFAPIVTTTKVKEDKKEIKETSKERKILAFGLISVVVIVVLIFLFIFLIKALRASNMY